MRKLIKSLENSALGAILTVLFIVSAVVAGAYLLGPYLHFINRYFGSPMFSIFFIVILATIIPTIHYLTKKQ